MNAVIEESGFYWNGPVDSVDRFTIKYKTYFPFNVSDTLDMPKLGTFERGLKVNKTPVRILFDTVYKISGRYFSVYGYEKTDSLQEKGVVGTTTIYSNMIEFRCELISGNNDTISRNFMKSSIDLINSIIIKKGKLKP